MKNLLAPIQNHRLIKSGYRHAKMLALVPCSALILFSCSETAEEQPISESAISSNPSFELAQAQSQLTIIPAEITEAEELGEAERRAGTWGGPDRGRFNITLKYLIPPTVEQKAVFEEAAGRWESIILKDVPSVTGTLPSAFVGFPPVVENGTIDDIIIEVVLAPIDGPGAILGQAGPVYIRNVDNLPVSGVMFFDVEDLAVLEEYDLFYEVIVHEMGHVLGIGTLWNFERELVLANSQGYPYFNGKFGHLFWRLEGGRNFLPVEADGGPGTAFSYWDEEIMGNELMTGYINLGENPLSTITAGSLKDLGYIAAALAGERYDLAWGTPGIGARISGSGGLDIASKETLLKPVGVVVSN